MATNFYITPQKRTEQTLLEDLVIESIKMYGQDIYYLPRTIVNEDRILGDDIPSTFSSAYKVEVYIENIDGFDGEGDLFTKFGVEIRDQATFIMARRRWDQTVKRNNSIVGVRPREGDLIYLPLSKSLFEIMHVEHEQPFYQLQNLTAFKMRCELFVYNDENLNTGVTDIDAIEDAYAYKLDLLLDSEGSGWSVGDTVYQTLTSGVVVNGNVTAWNPSTKILSLTHIGSDDDAFHMFETGNVVHDDSDNNRILVSTITIDNQISANEQNSDFSDVIAEFLDFSESNPFGDPENN